MLADIQPGQQINVTVTSEPKSAAQRKTLIRLCEKDEQVSAERKRLKRARPVKYHRRGGRPWGARPYRVPVVKTVATRREGFDELVDEAFRQIEFADRTGWRAARQRERRTRQFVDVLTSGIRNDFIDSTADS